MKFAVVLAIVLSVLSSNVLANDWYKYKMLSMQNQRLVEQPRFANEQPRFTNEQPRMVEQPRFTNEQPRTVEQPRMVEQPRFTNEQPRTVEQPRMVEQPRFTNEQPRTVEQPRFTNEQPRTVEQPRFTNEQPRMVEQPRFTNEKPRTVEQPRFTNEQPRTVEQPRMVEQPRFTNEQPRTVEQPRMVEQPRFTNEQPRTVEQPRFTNEQPRTVEQPRMVEQPRFTNEQPRMVEQPKRAVPVVKQTRTFVSRQAKDACLNRQSGEMIANPENPNSFLVCQKNGEVDVMQCPSNLVFNTNTLRCDNNRRAPLGCAANPCKNNATCTDLPQFKFRCDCQPGFIGKFCDREDVCSSSTCGPKGLCVPLGQGSSIRHYCVCNNGESFGLTCDSAERNPCNDANSESLHFPTKSNPSIFVQCDGHLPTLKVCPWPLIFVASKQECDWRNK